MIYRTINPQKFLGDLTAAGLIEHIQDLWSDPQLSTIQTDEGEVAIATERMWKRWLYSIDGKPPRTPNPRQQLLLWIKYQELRG